MTLKYLTAFAMAASLAISACSGPVEDNNATEFVAKASVANLFEIESSRLAVERARHPQVRELAQQIITDHTAAGENLKSALTEAGSKLTPATALDEKHQDMLDDLRAATPEDFDDKYVDIQTAAHDEALTLYKDYADGSRDGPVKRFAQTTLPTLQTHKDHVTTVDGATHAGETHSGVGHPATSPSAAP